MHLLMRTRTNGKQTISTPLYACCVLLWNRSPRLLCTSSSSFSSSLALRPSAVSQHLCGLSHHYSNRFCLIGSNKGPTIRWESTAIHGTAIPGQSCLSSSSCPCCGNNKRKLLRISFLTDVEGDGAYLDRYVNQSKVLAFAKPTDDDYYTKPFYDRHIVFQESPKEGDHDDMIQTMLIFGGDATDKGGSDLYVLRQLLSLQRRYGTERVKFILGNRDINKMRIWQELLYFSNYNHVYWDHPSSASSNNKSPHGTLVDKLKWMLSKTMGSPDAFQLRREELSKLKKRAVSEEEVVQSYIQTTAPCGAENSSYDASAITTTTTTTRESKMDNKNEVGLMTAYLNNAKILCKVGSVLFLHGALPPPLFTIPQNCTTTSDHNNLLLNYFDYAMPWKEYTTATTNIGHLQDWIDTTNQFATTEISSWNNLTSIDVYRHKLWSPMGGYYNDPAFVPGSSLLQYGMSSIPGNAAANNTINNPTVVYNNWPFLNSMNNHGEKNDNVTATKWLLSQFYHKYDIQAIVTGHKPQGDLPLPIQIRPISDQNMLDNDHHSSVSAPHSPSSSKSASLWILSCDTSYSGDTVWIDDQRQNLSGRGLSKSGRGDLAVSEVLIDQCIHCYRLLRLQSHGVLSDGSTYQSPNLVHDSELIGLPLDHEQLEIMNCTKEKIHNNSKRLSSNETDLKWWVKTKLDENHYLVSASRGFHVWNSIARKRRREES